MGQSFGQSFVTTSNVETINVKPEYIYKTKNEVSEYFCKRSNICNDILKYGFVYISLPFYQGEDGIKRYLDVYDLYNCLYRPICNVKITEGDVNNVSHYKRYKFSLYTRDELLNVNVVGSWLLEDICYKSSLNIFECDKHEFAYIDENNVIKYLDMNEKYTYIHNKYKIERPILIVTYTSGCWCGSNIYFGSNTYFIIQHAP